MPGNPADNSAILALPYIQPSQSQKHVTHNEAISTLDVLVQLVVAGFGATTPPADPAPGDVHALGAAPTGAWAGQDNTLATWHDGAWVFITPLAGWRAWGVSEAELRIWDGTAWGLPTVAMDNLDGVGINTTADATNRLSVSAPATLLSHEGADHQLKINKAGTTDTASLLFQSGWTGHAEMGLSGDTDFAIKVSDDGTTWNEALVFDAANGTASGTALQAGTTDATAGKLMAVGAFGLGLSASTASLAPGNDLDALTTQGFWRYDSSTTGAPGVAGTLLHFTRLNGAYSQIAISHVGQTYMRYYSSSTWSAWESVVRLDSLGGLTIDTSTLRVDAANNRVGIGTTSPGTRMHVSEAGNLDAATIDVSNASFGNTAFVINAARAADPAFDFAEFSSNTAATPDLEFSFSGDGNGKCDGSWTGGGADYAEYFEWADGNPKGEDRRGISVVLVGDQIREAKEGEDVIGVISGNPSVVGDAAAFRWKGKYLRDDFGSPVIEEYEAVQWTETITRTDDEGESVTRDVIHSYGADALPEGITVPEDATRTTQTRRKLSPGYDPDYAYTPREQRREWDTVGLMGKLRLRKGQVSRPGWIKMRDVSDSVEEWLVR